jgi:hypothetical protein
MCFAEFQRLPTTLYGSIWIHISTPAWILKHFFGSIRIRMDLAGFRSGGSVSPPRPTMTRLSCRPTQNGNGTIRNGSRSGEHSARWRGADSGGPSDPPKRRARLPRPMYRMALSRYAAHWTCSERSRGGRASSQRTFALGTASCHDPPNPCLTTHRGRGSLS